MKRKLLATLLLLSMVFGMTACTTAGQQSGTPNADDLDFSVGKPDAPPVLPDVVAQEDVPVGVVNPANIYEPTASIAADGFVYSDFKVIAKSTELPAGIKTDDVSYFSESVGADGKLLAGNMYYFVSITITNESNETNELDHSRSFIVVVGSDNKEVATLSNELRYAAAEGQKPNDHSKRDFARVVLNKNESKTFTLGYIMSDADVAQGEPIFVVGSTGDMPAGGSGEYILPYQAFRMN
jgi:hypothetical protein